MAAKELKQLSTTATSTISSVTSHLSTSSTKHGQSASTESLLQLQPKKSKQTNIVSHTFKGIDMPFSSSEIVAVKAQALCAVISANLSCIEMEANNPCSSFQWPKGAPLTIAAQIDWRWVCTHAGSGWPRRGWTAWWWHYGNWLWRGVLHLNSGRINFLW